jgi:carboxypeptidase C (cathepsin A)
VEGKPPVVTHHTITLGGTPLRYTAHTGMMPIRNERTGVTEGNIFYVYYAKDDERAATRPLTFVFNGGPGSSTVWLHMGAFGPRIVRLNADGTNPPPPYGYQDNQHTLLDQTDLVFLDPVGTGYSRATRPDFGPNFWGLDEDVQAVGEFVRLFLVKYERWGSPKFLAGESYGTTRAAHLSGALTDDGIALNGVVLLSTVLNFEASSQASGNDVGWANFLPTYAATAWYHKRLPPDLQAQPLEQVLRQAEALADGPYLLALHKGAGRLPAAERQQIVAQLARFTGLPAATIEQNDLRVPLGRFNTSLLRDQERAVGRLDSRFTTFLQDAGGDRQFDPSDASIRNAFTPVLNDYVRRELGYENEDVYYILGGGIGQWRYPQRNGYADVTPSLERAFAKNPAMRLYVAMGYYDAATPYWAAEYTLSHLDIAPEVRANNITTDHFTAGHMMYIDAPSMEKLRRDLRTFYTGAVPAVADR